jgi:hypothetical protein
MQWLDREFWNLYKMATNARPALSSGDKQSRVAVGQSSIVRISGTETVSSVVSSVSAASEWNSDEQRRLEAALVSHPSSLEPKERWRSISADVGSKTAGQCIARFKFIRDTLKSGGSVAAAEAKAALVSAASDKSMAPTKMPVPTPVVSVSAAAASESSMPPIEIPDDLLTITGVIAGAGMCSGSFPPLYDVCMNFKCFPSVRMEDVVYDGWDVCVAHTVSLQVTLSRTLLVTRVFLHPFVYFRFNVSDANAASQLYSPRKEFHPLTCCWIVAAAYRMKQRNQKATMMMTTRVVHLVEGRLPR